MLLSDVNYGRSELEPCLPDIIQSAPHPRQSIHNSTAPHGHNVFEGQVKSLAHHHGQTTPPQRNNNSRRNTDVVACSAKLEVSSAFSFLPCVCLFTLHLTFVFNFVSIKRETID